MSTTLDASFLRAVVLKVAYHPEIVRRTQAAIIYAALAGNAFTADEVLPKEITGDDVTVSGIAVGSLCSMKLLMRVGRCKSPAESRNGAWVNRWVLAYGKSGAAKTWLARNGFPPADVVTGQLLFA